MVSLAAMYLAARGGWLGTDVDRGGEFCEAARSGWLKQPANALSNLGFVVAGLAIGWRAGFPEGRLARPGLAAAFAVVVVLLGPGSMAMHATQTTAGGHLDMSSMFLVASFAAAYALMRWRRRSSAYFGAVFTAALVACELIDQIPGEIPVVMHAGNLVFGALLILTLVLEVRLRGRDGGAGEVRWIRYAFGSLTAAFVVWNLSKDAGPLCDPGSWVQGHAIWHLLCAVSAYCLYRYWCSAAGVGRA